jgi:hypothetical protein
MKFVMMIFKILKMKMKTIQGPCTRSVVIASANFSKRDVQDTVKKLYNFFSFNFFEKQIFAKLPTYTYLPTEKWRLIRDKSFPL